MTFKYNIERNPILTHSYMNEEGEEIKTTILCIGDPHFGKRFSVGVPKHRIGEREINIYKEFKKLLNLKVDYIVIMGDVFDKFIVTPTIIRTVYEALHDVRDTPIYVIPGNHDLSKDNTKTSSFSLFRKLVNSTLKNVKVIEDTSIISINDDLIFLLDSYNPFNKESILTDDLINTIEDKKKENPNLEVLTFGHWDSMDLTENGWIPSKKLLELSTLVISGHEHSYREYLFPFDSFKTTVLYTGSLQPYSHAEDNDSTIYKTIKESDIIKYDLSKDFKYNCLRILCNNYFILEEPIDCLSLTFKILLKEEEELEEDEEIDIENYSSSIQNWIKTEEMNKDIREELINILEEKLYI